MTANTIEPEAEDTEPKFRTRADAEAEIAAINEEIERLQELVQDDIERLEEQRDEIEEELDDLPDEEEEEEVFADRIGASNESPYPRELVVIGPRGGTSAQKFELHPLASLMPYTKAECEMLRASIERNGVVVPILIYQGKILDGRKRACFAEMFHKPVKIEVFEGTEEEARRLVVSCNLVRRHLTTTQAQQLVAGELSSDDETVERVHEQQLAAADLGEPD